MWSEKVSHAGEFQTRRRESMQVDYRHCAELETAIAVAAILRAASVRPADDADIRRQIDTYRDKRHKTQPREPSAGCMFKNPPGVSAGRLIVAGGCGGLRLGSAEVSTKHANFIQVDEGGSAADVIEVMAAVRARVIDRFDVELHAETRLVGFDDEVMERVGARQ